MEAELVALATAGATALVQQMVTDTWASARDRVVSFFSRGAADPEAVGADLDAARAELVEAQHSADEGTAADIQAEWRSRMRRTLQADPQAAAELRALLDELVSALPAQQTVEVHNTISGGTQHGPVIQTGTIGSLHLGGSDGRVRHGSCTSRCWRAPGSAGPRTTRPVSTKRWGHSPSRPGMRPARNATARPPAPSGTGRPSTRGRLHRWTRPRRGLRTCAPR